MLINELGRFNPSRECRTFSSTPNSFYKLNDIEVDYSSQHQLAVSNSFLHGEHEISQIEGALRTIKDCIKDNKNYSNLYQATAIPFCLSLPETMPDVGTQLEENWLPSLKLHYEKQVQGGYFKATLQGHTKLSKHLTVAKGSGYENFLGQLSNSTVVGYYFPTAFQEFDINSQRKRIASLPEIKSLALCLSGPIEIAYSLLCYPKLLFNLKHYSPILCASSLEHQDPRMIILFKSYGPHLEFWLMTQMLTPTKTQVSEQWSGGITIYKTL